MSILVLLIEIIIHHFLNKWCIETLVFVVQVLLLGFFPGRRATREKRRKNSYLLRANEDILLGKESLVR